MADVEILCSPCHDPDNVKEPEPISSDDSTTTNQASPLLHSPWRWWILVVINTVFLLLGQSGADLLSRFYFDQGGKSKWMATLVQSVAFPILFFPLLFFFPHQLKSLYKNSDKTMNSSSLLTIIFLYICLGILLAGDSFMFTIGFIYLPLSAYSFISSSQLAFNAIFSFFINSQKLTFLILNSVALIILSASLVATQIDSSDDGTSKVTKNKQRIGFVFTLVASAGYALILCLMELSFEKVLKRESFSVVIEMQIWVSFVATCVCIVGLFASGEGKGLKDEMMTFKAGKMVYILTLVGTALCWQIYGFGTVTLIFVVSSLFSNVISMLSLLLVPVYAIFLYHEKMDGVKVVAMLLAILGFSSYIYQYYLDQKSHTTELVPTTISPENSVS